MFDAFQKITQLTGIKHGLRDRILRARFDLPLKPLNLFVKINCAGIHTNADTESSRFTDRIVSEIETMVQLVDHVCKTDRVDIEDSGRVRIRSHLRRIARDHEDVAQAQCRRAQKIRHHAEKVPVTTAVVQHRLDADLLFHEYRGCDRAHARLRARTVRNVHTVNTRIF